ncbi:plant UBX domain-containing protein 4-like [Wolffia australiana]
MEASIVPSEEQQRDLIDSFCSIASSSPAEAKFFLESHLWRLEDAVQSFFEDSEPVLEDPSVDFAAPRRPRRIEEEEEDKDDEEDEDYLPPEENRANLGSSGPARVSRMASSSGSGRPSKGSGGKPAGRIRTLADLNRRPASGSDSEDSDGPMEYFTGGEKSGMMVQDPSKGNADVESIFEQARQMGAAQGPSEYQPSSGSGSFTGTGRLLSGESVQVSPQPPERVLHEVIFWADGFTVDDGPLRRFDDPGNAAFLESIKKSECPRELEPADRRTAVHVNLSRREQKCPEPVKRFSPFAGSGRTLTAGGTSSTITSTASAAAVAAPAAGAGLKVDESLPVTSIQLRLGDGTRLVARFNEEHMVADIRAFIDAARPGANRGYRLQTMGFPPTQLTDPAQTIRQAGLANSVVIQKF